MRGMVNMNFIQREVIQNEIRKQMLIIESNKSANDKILYFKQQTDDAKLKIKLLSEGMI
jgi:hypothetical protein